MKRYLSLDILRGLTIFGMVFSAIIPHRVLPAWMFHIQTPPPTHKLDMSISGISWVDLVFPIFIFCMGVAIPFAGRRRLEGIQQKGSTLRFVLDIIERFFMLWLFSYLYVFLNFSTVQGWWPQLATVLGFLALFPLYYVLPKSVSKKRMLLIRAAGLILVTAVIIYGHFKFDEVITLARRGIIIFLLSFIYLFGALIWYFTRDSFKARAIAFAAVVLFAATTMYMGFLSSITAIKEIKWIVNFEYIYFLMILIPATYIGDLLYSKTAKTIDYDPVRMSREEGGKISYVLIGAVIYILWQMVALYKLYYVANILVSLLVVSAIHLLVLKNMVHYKKESLLAAVLAVAGSVIILAEGSITKVPCTIAYCFITTSISIYLLMITDWVSHKMRSSYMVRIFAGAGSNPLMSYIAFGSFVMPLFKLTGFIYIYQAAYPQGYPWIGVLRAAMAVLFTMAIVALASEKKVFWRA